MNASPDIARPSGIRDEFGVLLRLDRRDVAGLTWLKHRARFWLTALKRRRKYLPRGVSYTQQESAAIEVLTDLEREAGRLLAMAERSEDTT